MNTLPSGLSWPECMSCGQPVTAAQQAIGAYQFFEGGGIVHRKCYKAVLVKIEAQAVAS